MDYRLKINENGRVNALYRTGQDIVKNEMTPEAAEKIIASNELSDSDRKGYVHAGNWYFEGDEIKAVKKVETSSTYGKVGKNGGKK